MAISDIRSAITTSLKNTISSIEICDVAPAVINAPVIYIVWDKPLITYQQTAGSGTWTLNLIVVLIAPKVILEEAQKMIDTYALPTGNYSVRAAVLSATSSSFAAIWCNDADAEYVESGGNPYLTMRWKVKVMMYQ